MFKAFAARDKQFVDAFSASFRLRLADLAAFLFCRPPCIDIILLLLFVVSDLCFATFK